MPASSATSKSVTSGVDGRSDVIAKRPTLGFGVPATSDPHHFKVFIPRSNKGRVQVSEFLGLQSISGDVSVIDRVLLNRTKWTAIRGETQRVFNSRLKSHELSTSAWKVGDNLVDRLLGKELCVLAWAVEHMEMAKVPVAVRNWLSLRPEERWWLFGITAICTGGIDNGDKGWRLALRHALGDVAQSEQLAPTTLWRRAAKEADHPELDLFGSE